MEVEIKVSVSWMLCKCIDTIDIIDVYECHFT